MFTSRNSVRHATRFGRKTRNFTPAIDGLEQRIAMSTGGGGGSSSTANAPFVALEHNGTQILVWSNGTDVFYQVGGTSGTTYNITNNGTSGYKSVAAGVAVNQNNEFVVAYTTVSPGNTTGGRYFQRFSAPGVAVGSVGSVAINNGLNHIYEQIAIDNAGDVVTVQIADPTADGEALSFQEWDPNNNSAGKVFVDQANEANDVSVSMDQTTGTFVVAYTDATNGGSPDVPGYSNIAASIYQKFATTPTTTINVAQSSQNNSNDNPSVSMNDSGNFAVAWVNSGTSGVDGIVEQEFNSSGTALTQASLVKGSATYSYTVGSTTYTTVANAYVTVALSDNNSLAPVVAWETTTSNSASSSLSYGLASSTGFSTATTSNGASNLSVATDDNGDVYYGWVTTSGTIQTQFVA